MNAEHLISRLSLVEAKSETIWKLIHKYYGDDFLLECIEDEYGITNASSERLQKIMENRVAFLQTECEKRLGDLKDTY
jgi:hypothetical protein